ncbi:TonB-dependent receptor plug domain-containing protein [Pseudoalteromonas umbrosa]|uniref:TonB-dependent receptor plug domain-containing protein n=1 Tax=Pseudoalteromonas umbrosa TaxID=3048489 RepID=UPI0024C3ABA1|nr:TonB-dependent receptor [Pseudoalteromonas sp. B95]MDK1287284.1 TonB-dependent receptor [Pseudoalteromonas sp. B95]
MFALTAKKRFILSPIMLCMAMSAHAQTKKEDIEHIEVIYKRSSITSEITEDTEKLIEMPGALGDPLRAVFALPGVVAAGGSMSEPAVRGSSPSDNMFEVDFMPAGYIFHDFGSSIFNRHIIQDFQLYSAGYGAGYSNATGAVFDVTLRNPKYQPITTTLDFSMFNAGFFVEGQATENTAFYVSGRKSTLPLFFSEGEELEDDDGEPSGVTINDAPDDHDYQGKFLWDINNSNTLTFNFTGAEDSAAAGFSERAELAQKTPEFQGDARFIRDFNSQSILWDHYNKKFHLRVGIGALDHSGRLEFGKQPNNLTGFFEQEGEKQLTYKARLNYSVNPQHRFVFDAAYFDNETSYEYDTFQYLCTEIDPDCDLKKGDRISGKRTIDLDSGFVGITHIWQPHEDWQTEIGVQSQHNRYTDETFTSPRVAVNYHVTPNSVISAKVGRYNRMQDVEYILPEIGNPALKSQVATHSTLGFRQMLENEWSWSIEGYYKTMEDLPLAIDAGSDAHLLYSNQVEGRAYGIDLLVNKNKTDNWYGWMALSYAKSERTDLSRNVTRDYYADTPLVFNAVLNYDINELWQGGFNFTARSGQAYTPIVGVRENPDHAGRFLPVYGDPFSERFKTYHRLDVRFERKTIVFGLEGKLILELMNAYGQDNVAYIDLDYDKISSVNDLHIKEENDDFEMRPSIGFSVTF